MKRSFSNIILWDICADNTKIRLFIVSFCFAVFFCGLSYRLIIVATNGYVKPEYQVKSSNFRKEIVDRNGNLLAVNLPSSSLFVNPQKVINPEQSLERLSKILPEIDKTKLLAELKGNKSFVWVKRDLLPKEQEAVLNLAMPGFSFEQEQKRIYTFSNLLSHVIGYVGRDLAGLAGLERSYDKFLTNSDFDLAQPEQLKKPLELSIDVRLQNILNEEIDKTLKEFSAIGAVGIIANPNNGEILALISKPDFNPHYPSSAKPEELFNMASLGIYEMGSVFKTLTMAVGFDTDAIAMNDAYDISYMKVGAFNVKDYHPRHGWHSVPEIFLHSSNIGVSQIMLEVGKNDFKKYLKRLGLLDQLKIELPERGTPLFPSDKRWSDLTSVVMSYGYGISISPLHFIQAVLPVVNGGTLYDLTLIKRQDEPLVGAKVFSEKTSKQMSELFRFVVKEGTGRRADVKGYLVGGKTGTAEKLTADGHGKRRYLKNSRMSSFLGVLPAFNPQYVIFIMFDEPKGTKESFGFATAGWTAAPTVGRVLERMVSLYGIEPIEKGEEL
ncbi:peptidoglycan D,D-transpeptidase FtsI family protein [Rickettsia endosymbiont of Culicoides newsteadi]|uniref:peptidoglycan D,D-transpeptidase FtsI family protein n=1 Tax=Rickettsia endosymbiont of Culicoides newsteadi TaxID=1961830 RepID=UPI000B9AE002|nr:penicillin-binding protein 2 [Rickettsia endosymbiont of Culicoides newsteadi]